MAKPYSSKLSPQERKKRQQYFGATVITCIAIIIVFSVAHVVELGANRMEDMKNRATYDLAEMKDHIRAAGEDIIRHEEHEKQEKAASFYALTELENLLLLAQWYELGEVIPIPAGSFRMGSDSARTDSQNRPEHKVDLADYMIDKYLVTQAEYARFVESTKHRPPLDWDDGIIPDEKYMHPVTMVTWYDASAYCAWEGKRLPTEAEWEKAARGADGRRWPWGNKMDASKLNTYYHVGSSTEVMHYKNGVSPYGVYDMAGNVSEWTASDFAPYEGSDAAKEIFQPKKVQATSAADRTMKVADLVPVDGVFKVRRGGSWKSDPFSTSAFHRNFSMPYYASDFFGFRCVQDVSKAEVVK